MAWQSWKVAGVVEERPYRAGVSATGLSPDLAGKAAGGRRLIAIVYADMVGYSRLSAWTMPAPCAACALCGER